MQQNIVPLKTCILDKTFQVFMLNCVNWLSKTYFVKFKINLDIILSEITFDNGVVKRWVPFFLEVIQVNNLKNIKNYSVSKWEISTKIVKQEKFEEYMLGVPSDANLEMITWKHWFGSIV